jgi:hypothetical protein
VKRLAFVTMATSPHAQGRRTYVVDRDFQLKYSLLLGSTGLGVSLLFGGMIYLAHVDAFRHVPPGTEIAAELQRAGSTIVWLTLGTAILMAVALSLLGVLITHRVAGPIYVMNHYLSMLSNGRYPKMRPLRKHDELKDFFEGLQTTIETLRTREVQDAALLEEAIAALGPSPATGPAVDKLRAMRDQKLAATSVQSPPAR